MAIFLEQFIQAEPDFFNIKDPVLTNKRDVRDQAAIHLIRDAVSTVINKKRPFETEEYRKYREENRRKITADAVIQFEQMLIKALKQTSIDYTNVPAPLQMHLESAPYKFMNTNTTLDNWIHKVLIPYSLLDPNAITIELPVNELNPFTPPINLESDGGIDPDRPLMIKTKIISYANWKVISINHFSMLTITVPDAYPLEHENGEIKMVDYFYVADDVDWYIYLPLKIEKGEITYQLLKWYPHDYGALPYASLPGKSTMNDEGRYYQETYVTSYYEYADEFVSRFQDDQVVHTRYAYPREIIDGVLCTECNGSGLRNVVGFGNKEIGKVSCKTCNGEGFLNSASPSGRTIRKKDMLGKDTKEPVAFVHPDTSILEHTTQNSFFFLEEGRKSIGLDSIQPVQEAEETKKMREQVKIEKLLNYAYAVIYWEEKHLNQKYSLLNTTGTPVNIKLQLPLSIAVKGEEALKEEINNSLPVDRYHTIKKYIQEKYSSDLEKQRIHLLALLYAPFLGMNEPEIQFRITQGSYDKRDLIRADKAVYAFAQLKGEAGFMNPDKDAELLIKAEEIVKNFFPLEIEPPPPPDPVIIN